MANFRLATFKGRGFPMKTLVVGLMSCALAACAGARPNSIVGAFSMNARSQMDDNKCQEFGYKKGSPEYGNCRIELEKARATSQTGTNISVR
jgi:hypothetical protein